jgi:hypothetical protein
MMKRIFISLAVFLMLPACLVMAQEKQKKDELKMERNIDGNRFMVYNNFVNWGSGFGRLLTSPDFYNPMEVGYNFRIKRTYFKAGYLRSDVLGMFGRRYQTELNDFHVGIGFRRETRNLNVAYYGGVSRVMGRSDFNVGFGGWGAYAEAQFSRKIYYDIGIGPTLFVAYNNHFPMAGLRIDVFMSSAYKGKINMQ